MSKGKRHKKKSGNRKNSASTSSDQALERLRSLPEDELVRSYLMPMLTAAGYRDMHFHGGAYEEGKDIIAWERDPILGTNLVVFQVRLKEVSPTADGFTREMASMIQCCTQPVSWVDGNKYTPTKAYYVTPYVASVRGLASGSAVLEQEKHRLRVIDGPQILALLQKHVPSLYVGLVGQSEQLRQAHASLLNNRALIQAIRGKAARQIESFYVNIDTTLDRRATSLLLTPGVATIGGAMIASTTEWRLLKETSLMCQALLDVALIAEAPEQVECRYEESKRRHAEMLKPMEQDFAHRVSLRDAVITEASSVRAKMASIDAEMSDVSKKQKTAELQARSSHSHFADLKESMQKFLRTHFSRDLDQESQAQAKSATSGSHGGGSRPDAAATAREILAAIASRKDRDATSLPADKLREILNLLEIGEERAGQDVKSQEFYRRSMEGLKREFWRQEQVLGVLDKRVADARREVNELRQRFPKNPQYEFAHNLSGVLAKFQAVWKQRTSEANTENVASWSGERLRAWLTDLASLQAIGRKLAGAKSVSESLEPMRGVAQLDNSRSSRLSVSVDRLLGSGLNLALLGEAGSGKSTALQMYARECLGSDAAAEGVLRSALFVPLTMLVADCPDSAIQQDMLELLVRFYDNAERRIQRSALEEIVQDSASILMFDGLDEVVGECSWMLTAVVAFSKKFPCQLVVSSRVSGSYVAEIPFLSVTMLPLTDRQRSEFIRLWFRGSADSESVDNGKRVRRQISKHEGLGEAVRSPLLLTVLCSLSDAGAALPSDEARLFDTRARLLLGDYDKHKGAHRLKAPAKLLEECCHKIAYGLHVRNLRLASMAEIMAIAREALGGRWGSEAVEEAVRELVEPCNVLTEMAFRAYGFGHLRFQEHFAACELNDRSVQVLPLLGRSWWHGVCCLYAAMASSLEWLMDLVAVEGVSKAAMQTLSAMTDAWVDASEGRHPPATRSMLLSDDDPDSRSSQDLDLDEDLDSDRGLDASDRVDE